MRFIITGTPRSATRYMAVLLQALNVPCTHERTFRPHGALIDAVRWYHADDCGESSWLAWAFLGVMPGPVPVFHQRRDPWLVIDSLAHRNQIVKLDTPDTDHQRRMRDVVEVYCPRLAAQDNAIDRAAVLLLDWNRCIEEAAAESAGTYVSYRVEALSVEHIQHLTATLGLARSDASIARALRSTPNTTNQGRAVEHDATITDPHVLRYLREQFPNHTPAVQKIKPMEDAMPPEQLAELMSPALVEEVNEYAALHGYPTVDALQTA